MRLLPITVLLAATISLAEETVGTARCRGLFLWNGASASANASDCEIRDSTVTGILAVNASFRFFRANGSWENGWEVKSRREDVEGSVGVGGNFRFLNLSAQISGNTDFARASVLSVIHPGDSLFWAGTRLGGGTVGGIRSTWTSGSMNGFLDTMQIGYRGRFIRKGLLLGGRHGKHLVEFSGDIFHSRRAPVDGEHYAFRDASELWTGNFLHRFKGGDSEWEFRAKALHLDASLFGLRTEGDNVKRFAYLPVKANAAILDGALRSPGFELSLGGGGGHLRLPHRKARFEETLAPNRALDQSTAQALSFALFKRNYRLFGDASGWFLHARIEKPFHFQPGRWHLIPQTAADFVYAQGEWDMELQKETAEAFLIHKTTANPHRGDAHLAGIVAEFAFFAESPQKRFFGKIAAAQIIPLFFHKNVDRQKAGEEDSSPTHKAERLSPFKTGFGIEASAGYRL